MPTGLATSHSGPSPSHCWEGLSTLSQIQEVELRDAAAFWDPAVLESSEHLSLGLFCNDHAQKRYFVTLRQVEPDGLDLSAGITMT